MGVLILEPPPVPAAEHVRWRLRVDGAVQGVGFRPCVYRLARALGLAGFVENSTQGVTIEVEGDATRVDEFVARLEQERPPRALIAALDAERVEALSTSGFEIRASASAGTSRSAPCWCAGGRRAAPGRCCSGARSPCSW